MTKRFVLTVAGGVWLVARAISFTSILRKITELYIENLQCINLCGTVAVLPTAPSASCPKAAFFQSLA
jgi:hypothetical protein